MRRQRPIDISYYDWSITRWWTSGTRAKLDALGRGILRDLLDLAYAQGKIPADHKILAEICACSEADFDLRWKVVGRHFSRSKHDSEVLENRQATVWRTNYFRYIENQRARQRNSGQAKASGINTMITGGLDGGGNQPYEPNTPNEHNRTNTKGGGGRPAPNGTSARHPETAAAVRAVFPGTDDAMVSEIVTRSETAYRRALNGHTAPPLTDKVISDAIKAAHWPQQESAAGFRRKVPRIIQTWTEECIQKGIIQ